MGCSRSLKMALFARPYTTFYWSAIVSIALYYYYFFLIFIIIIITANYWRERAANNRMSPRQLAVLLGPLNAWAGRPRDVTTEFHLCAWSHMRWSRWYGGARGRCNHKNTIISCTNKRTSLAQLAIIGTAMYLTRILNLRYQNTRIN